MEPSLDHPLLSLHGVYWLWYCSCFFGFWHIPIALWKCIHSYMFRLMAQSLHKRIYQLQLSNTSPKHFMLSYRLLVICVQLVPIHFYLSTAECPAEYGNFKERSRRYKKSCTFDIKYPFLHLYVPASIYLFYKQIENYEVCIRRSRDRLGTLTLHYNASKCA